MTTFQAIILGIIGGFSGFLPVSANVHHRLAAFFLGWPELSGPALGAVSLGTLISVLIYFRHDWASIISSLLQVILFRKKPMTLDERMSFFLVLTTVPTLGVKIYLADQIPAILRENMLLSAAILAAFALPFIFLDSWGRKNKGMFDWNWLDSFLVGLGAATAIIPGFGAIDGVLIVALARNFNRESAVKFSFYVITPLLALNTYSLLNNLSFKAGPPMPDFSWLSFFIMVLVSGLCGLLAIGGVIKNMERGTFKQYGVYRIVLALVILGFAFWTKKGMS